MKVMKPIAFTDFDGDNLVLSNAEPDEDNGSSIAWVAVIPANDNPPAIVGVDAEAIDRMVEWLIRQKRLKR